METVALLFLNQNTSDESREVASPNAATLADSVNHLVNY